VAGTKPALEDMVMKAAFWSKKRVLVTGHTGFKGGWLSLWLQLMGAEVVGYSLQPPTEPSLFKEARVSADMHSIIGDIRDLDHLRRVIDDHQPEIVFHLAAQAIVRESYEDPLTTFDSNVMGTVKTLEAVRQSGCVRAVVVVTSDKCYENKEWCWGYREIDPVGGFDPYSSSKGCAELVTSAYRRSFFKKRADFNGGAASISSARAGNVIGGGDWATDRLIPDMMKSFMSFEPLVIRKPNAIRPWQFVLEPLRGYLMLAEKLWTDEGHRFDSAWNFGPDDSSARPVQWIVEKLTALWGGGARWELDNAEHPHEAHYLKLDCSKAKSLLGWKPEIGLSKTLELIALWYRKFQEGADMYDETTRQILNYQEMIAKASREE
jgi:CDP-glucose 4,6-dehydratase